MNPLTNMKNVLKLSEQELAGLNKTSWHDQYRDSAWIFVGGLPYCLSEGDIISVFSQYGEIVHINLARDKDTGKSRGFAFICYEDQRSTDLVVDNLNGIRIQNRQIRVDHVNQYKVPKSERDKVKQKTLKEKIKTENDSSEEDNKHLIPNIKKEFPSDVRETLADQIDGHIKLPKRLPIRGIISPKREEDYNRSTRTNEKRTSNPRDRNREK